MYLSPTQYLSLSIILAIYLLAQLGTFASWAQVAVVTSNNVPGTHGIKAPTTAPALQYMYCVQSAEAQYPVWSGGQSFEPPPEDGDDAIGEGLF